MRSLSPPLLAAALLGVTPPAQPAPLDGDPLFTLPAVPPRGAAAVAAHGPVAADFNGDGFVGAADLDVLLSRWNQPGAWDAIADVTNDGFVGAADLDVLLGQWNAGVGPGVGDTIIPLPVPAPLGLGAGALLSVVLLRAARRSPHPPHLRP